MNPRTRPTNIGARKPFAQANVFVKPNIDPLNAPLNSAVIGLSPPQTIP